MTRIARNADDPIGQLLDDSAITPSTLAASWRLADSESVRKLRAFAYVPRYQTAERMAKSFGWPSAGTVMDFWAKKVREKKEGACSKS